MTTHQDTPCDPALAPLPSYSQPFCEPQQHRRKSCDVENYRKRAGFSQRHHLTLRHQNQWLNPRGTSRSKEHLHRGHDTLSHSVSQNQESHQAALAPWRTASGPMLKPSTIFKGDKAMEDLLLRGLSLLLISLVPLGRYTASVALPGHFSLS